MSRVAVRRGEKCQAQLQLQGLCAAASCCAPPNHSLHFRFKRKISPSPLCAWQMVWEECRGIQEGRGLLTAFERPSAWRAFEGLLAAGLAFWVDQVGD